MSRNRHLFLVGMIALLAFALDQGSKLWVRGAYPLEPGLLIEVLPILNFTSSLNTGVNFGIGASGGAAQQWILIALAVVISAGLLIWAARARRAALSYGTGLVIGGALANALDRAALGGVFDFINMSCCGLHNPYAFNLADVAIFGGALIIALWGWDSRPEAPNADTGQRET